MQLIPFNVPYMSEPMISAVADSMRSQKLAGDGPATKSASNRLRALFPGAEAMLTPSCTHALEMAVRLLRVEPGDEIIVPSYTFTSTANAVVLGGAIPVFVDVDSITQNIDIDLVRQAITTRTRAVFCINYGGISPDIQELAEFCQMAGLILLEDNAHGIGASQSGRSLGTFGSMATQSFHETKNVQCGEGGALLINDEQYVERAEILREKGTNRSRFFRGQVDKYTWVDEGSSWLLADPLAAMLDVQLQNFSEIQNSRKNLWARYQEELGSWRSQNGISEMNVPIESDHPAHMYYMMMCSTEQRGSFISHLSQHGVMAAFHYQPLHSSEAGVRFGRVYGEFPNTQRAADCLIRLPLWAGMPESTVDRIITAVEQFKN